MIFVENAALSRARNLGRLLGPGAALSSQKPCLEGVPIPNKNTSLSRVQKGFRIVQPVPGASRPRVTSSLNLEVDRRFTRSGLWTGRSELQTDRITKSELWANRSKLQTDRLA